MYSCRKFRLTCHISNKEKGGGKANSKVEAITVVKNGQYNVNYHDNFCVLITYNRTQEHGLIVTSL